MACHYNPTGTPKERAEAATVRGDIRQFWLEAQAANKAAIDQKASGTEDMMPGPVPSYHTNLLTTMRPGPLLPLRDPAC